MDVSIGDMLTMQRELQAKYAGIWAPIEPATAPNKLLWGVGEIGEMIDVIKKHPDEIMTDPATREHFVEETCDVFMYLMDVLLCYGIDAEHVARIYRAKHAHNMARRYEGTRYDDMEGYAMETKLTADKRITIEGMSCGHCTARVERALNQLDGVIAKVDLDGADVSANRSITNDMLIKQIEDAGYRAVKIQEA